MRLLYLSALPWHSFEQRPHKFVRWFQNRFHASVTWVEPYPSRWPRWSDFVDRQRSNQRELQLTALPEWLDLIRVPSLPIEPAPLLNFVHYKMWQRFVCREKLRCRSTPTTLVVGKPSELALVCLEELRVVSSVYDAMDDFPAFHSGGAEHAMRGREMQIAKTVNAVMASSSALVSKFALLSRQVRHVGNAYDGQEMARPALQNLRLQHVAKSWERPSVFGYVGTIASWFDWRWVVELANSLPNAEIRLIGPIHCPVPALPANVRLCPPCTHFEALSSMAQFDVGLIPFLKNRLTDSVDPIKYHEYRALGLPVVSTSFGEMPMYAEKDSGLLLLNLVKESVSLDLTKIDLLLSHNNENHSIQRTDWTCRFNEVSELFEP